MLSRQTVAETWVICVIVFCETKTAKHTYSINRFLDCYKKRWARIDANNSNITWKGSGNIVICIMLYGRTSTQIITYDFEQKGRNHMVLTDISKFLCTAEQLQNSEYQLTKRMTCKQKRVSIRLLWSTCLLLPNSHLVSHGTMTVTGQSHYLSWPRRRHLVNFGSKWYKHWTYNPYYLFHLY